jgi:hypothetical protein
MTSKKKKQWKVIVAIAETENIAIKKLYFKLLINKVVHIPRSIFIICLENLIKFIANYEVILTLNGKSA